MPEFCDDGVFCWDGYAFAGGDNLHPPEEVAEEAPDSRTLIWLYIPPVQRLACALDRLQIRVSEVVGLDCWFEERPAEQRSCCMSVATIHRVLQGDDVGVSIGVGIAGGGHPRSIARRFRLLSGGGSSLTDGGTRWVNGRVVYVLEDDKEAMKRGAKAGEEASKGFVFSPDRRVQFPSRLLGLAGVAVLAVPAQEGRMRSEGPLIGKLSEAVRVK